MLHETISTQENIIMARYLDPKSDVVFKKIFGQHPKLLKSFLNAVLPLPENGLIESLEYLPSEQTPRIPTFKNTVVDVKCTDQQGRIFIVEMQIEWTDSFMQRLLFGASKAYVQQLQKGEEYQSLNPVYGLALLASPFDKESPDWYHHYKVVNIQKPERELKGLQLVFIELPKFKPGTVRDKKLQILWLRFMSEVEEKNRTISPELLEDPEIKEAVLLSEESAYTPAELEAYDQYWDVIRAQRTLIRGFYEQGKEEGIEQGIEKGKNEKAIEIARSLKQAGLSLHEIVKHTGLTEGEIKNLYS
ncbi:MAG: Rpn family recombination-promoting nuclease/putative transposase [Gammaproteobacteria bacterium]